MTTTITVKAHHGWPVKVTAFDLGGDVIRRERVESGETRDFYVHSGADLFVHEIQPGETDETEDAAEKTAASAFAFTFELKQVVKLNESDESGTVIGRAEYTNQRDHYLIRYRAADGRQVEDWWAEDALRAA